MNERTSEAGGDRIESREQTLSRRIVLLLIASAFVLVAQSLYSLSVFRGVNESIITVHDTAIRLDELGREIRTPIEDIRILSMEAVLAPSEALSDELFRVGHDTAVHQLRAGLAAIARRGIEQGELASDLNPEAFAGAIVALVLGIQVQAALGADLDPRPLLQAARQLVGAHIGGDST